MDATEQVFVFLERLVAEADVPAGYREALTRHFAVGRAQADAAGMAMVELPLLIHAALAGERPGAAPPIPLAGACLLVYLGADLFDNVADRELPPAWADPGLASLVAATYLAALPGLALARLEAAPAVTARLSQAFAAGLLRMSAGQYEDLVFAASPEVSPAASRAMLERKSGAEFALFAEAGAILAGAEPPVLHACAAYGLCLGTAIQILSDVRDIWHAPVSQDLLNGKRSLPVAQALAATTGRERQELLALLDAARRSGDCHGEARRLLARAGALRSCGLVVELYRRRALAALARANPLPPAAARLRALADELTLLPKAG